MVNLNSNVLFCIAEQLGPNPLTYLKLAAVSSLFYSVFTSDKLWLHLDVYNVKTNVFRSFQRFSATDQDKGMILFFWSVKTTHWHPDQAPLLTSNLFAVLGWMVMSYQPWPQEYEDNIHLMKRFLFLKPFAICKCGPQIRNDVEMALMVVKRYPSAYRHISPRLRAHPSVAELRNEPNPRHLPRGSVCSSGPRAMLSRESAIELVRLRPSEFEYIPKYHNDREIALAAACSGAARLVLKHGAPELFQDLDFKAKIHHLLLLSRDELFHGREATENLVLESLRTIPKTHEVDQLLKGMYWLLESKQAMLFLATRDRELLKYYTEFAGDWDIATTAYTHFPSSIDFVDSRLRSNPQFMEQAVASDVTCLSSTLVLTRGILEALTKAPNYDTNAIYLINTPSIICDHRVLRMALKYGVRWVHPNLEVEWSDDEELALDIVRQEMIYFSQLSERLRDRRDVAELALAAPTHTKPAKVQAARETMLDSLGPTLSEDLEFISSFMKKFGTSKEDLLRCKHFAVWSCAVNPARYDLLEDRFKSDIDMNIAILGLNFKVYKYMDFNMRHLPQIKAAMARHQEPNLGPLDMSIVRGLERSS